MQNGTTLISCAAHAVNVNCSGASGQPGRRCLFLNCLPEQVLCSMLHKREPMVGRNLTGGNVRRGREAGHSLLHTGRREDFLKEQLINYKI